MRTGRDSEGQHDDGWRKTAYVCGIGAPMTDGESTSPVSEMADSATREGCSKPWRAVRAESVIVASLRLRIRPSELLEISVPGIVKKLAGLEI